MTESRTPPAPDRLRRAIEAARPAPKRLHRVQAGQADLLDHLRQLQRHAAHLRRLRAEEGRYTLTRWPYPDG
jgi:hypothetical protein